MKLSNLFILFALLNVFFNSAVKAQMPMDGTDFMLDKLRLNRGIEGKENLFYDDVKGDPFIFKEFQKGTLYVLPDQKFDVTIRYDIYADQMHLKDKDQIYAINSPEKVKLIEAGSFKFIYTSYVSSPGETDKPKNSYFILKSDGKCKVLIKKNLRVQDAEPPKLYQEAKPAKFVPVGDTYFLKLADMNAVRIKSKKDLLAVLADKSDAIEKYVNSNKLDVKEIEDLVKIVTYYNSL